MPADPCPTCARLRATLDIERAITSEAVEAAAIGEAVIAALNGEEVSDFMASFPPVQRAQDLQQTCTLLYGDVEAQRRVIVEACAVLGVTEDDEADWPKLPGACDAIKTEVERLRSLAAPAGGVDVEEVLRLDREATPGPWHARAAHTEHGYRTSAISLDRAEDDGFSPEGLALFGRTITVGVSGHDAHLIATYRTAAPALAREVVALRAINAQQRANAEGTNRVLRDQEDEIARLRDALAAAEQKRDELRLTLAAERGEPEGARKGEVEAVECKAKLKGERWFVVHQRDGQPFVETFIGAGAERAARLTARAHAANWTDTYVMRGREVSSSDFEREAREERAAMLAADEVKP